MPRVREVQEVFDDLTAHVRPPLFSIALEHAGYVVSVVSPAVGVGAEEKEGREEGNATPKEEREDFNPPVFSNFPQVWPINFQCS